MLYQLFANAFMVAMVLPLVPRHWPWWGRAVYVGAFTSAVFGVAGIWKL